MIIQGTDCNGQNCKQQSEPRDRHAARVVIELLVLRVECQVMENVKYLEASVVFSLPTRLGTYRREDTEINLFESVTISTRRKERK